MFGAFGSAPGMNSIIFTSGASVNRVSGFGLQKRVSAVRGCRDIGKHRMIRNDYLPNIAIDPSTYQVRVDGEILTCEAAEVLPLSQRFSLF